MSKGILIVKSQAILEVWVVWLHPYSCSPNN